jgi:hypothetical protein
MHAFVRLFAAGVCAAAAASAFAAPRSVAPGKAPAAPSAATRAANARPDPAGLRPAFPAGLSSGSGAAVSSDPIAANTSPIPAGMPPPAGSVGVAGGGGVRVPSELPPADGGLVTTVPATAILGAGSSVRGPSQGADGAGGFAAADTARSFFFADANHDGELTHAEARRLSIMTMSFEEMDRNFDGVISRFEYDDSLL